jgi:hypothetical protein
VLPWPVAYDSKIELQIAPLADAQRPAEACQAKFGVRELAVAFIARCSPHPRSNAFQLTTPLHSPLNANFPSPHRNAIATDNPIRIVILSDQRESKGLSFQSLQLEASRSRFLIANDNPTRIVILSDQRESKGLSFRSLQLTPPRSRLLIANLELEFLATHTKRGLLRFSNRKKIAVSCPSPPIGEPSKLSSPLAHPDNCNRRTATAQHISNRNKNARFAFPSSRFASHELRVTSYDSRTTTRAAFRSTIPARPHADR